MAENITKMKKQYKQSLGKQCAAWGCDSRGLVEFEGQRISTAISFFMFPKDPGMRKVWCNRIKRVDGKDNFRVTNHIVLCEKHFTQSDIVRPPGGTQKRLKKGAKPVLFETMADDSSKRKAPVDRSSPRKKFRNFVSVEEPSGAEIFDNPELFVDNLTQTEENYSSLQEYQILQEENKKLKRELLEKKCLNKM